MVWASDLIVPATLAIALQMSQGADVAVELQITAAPKTPSGSLFDCTAASACTLMFSNGANLYGPALNQYSITPTLVTHTTTGIVITISAAQALAVIGEMAPGGVASGPVTLTATDGTTVLVIGQGRYSITVGP